MYKFLITVWPVYGHLFPSIAIAHALRARGHEVAFYTGEAACTIVETEGFTAFPFRRVDGEAIEHMLATGYHSAPTAWKRALKQKDLYRAWLLETVPAQVADINEVIEAWNPDGIFCDLTMWGPILVLSETQSTPIAVFSHTLACMLPGKDIPPIGLGLPPARNAVTRMLSSMGGAAVRVFTSDILHAANHVRRTHGLSPLDTTITAFAGRLPLYIVTGIAELDYNRCDLPPHVHYVGPCLWSRNESEGDPDWLGGLPKNQPWIYVSEGTLHNQAPLVLHAAAQGLANLPVQVIMTSGGRRAPEELDIGQRAANIRIERWVPENLIVPQVSVVVAAGGAGTIMTALRAGVPLVIVPTEWDKPENARRVVYSGAGLRLAPQDCTPSRLRHAVERVLHEPSFRQRAQELASAMGQYQGQVRAAELLEELVVRSGTLKQSQAA